ncbi:Hypothetical predicted protein [Paramuricea clavata]|uniref:Uncharacterized protein n=1 Tax=Paramuricea clavata TaxID=317549 RepID=A0A7D9H865_PARCT|nr:Hypothetical predicted protein [Paramuricea clavata]
MATSTKTHYFETGSNEIKLGNYLKSLIEKGDLTYYRYAVIPTKKQMLSEKKDRCIPRKLCVVVQFEKRMSPLMLRRQFAGAHIFIASLTVVGRPIVLSLMRLWVLCECHGLHYAQTAHSDTGFGFGGKKNKR